MTATTNRPVHSPTGASSMYRWKNCPGSVRLCATLPPAPTSEYAAEGTLGHEVAAKILLHENFTPELSNLPPGMIQAVEVYTEYVFGLLNSMTAPKVWIEHGFDLSKFYPNLYGTADCVIYDKTSATLHVIDYKHGKGIPVEVFEDGEPNTQLMFYGLGALIETKAKVSTVRLTVVQPRCEHPDGPIRSHDVSSLEMLAFQADLVDAAKRTADPNAPIVAGDHCRFCPAVAVCPELQNKALRVAQNEFAAAKAYEPKKLSEVLSMLPTLKAWIKGVEEFAHNEAGHGRIPPGFKLVEKRSTRDWQNEKEVAIHCMTLGMPPEQYREEPRLLSVAQLEKVVGKKEFAKEFSSFVVKQSSGTTLVPESDNRPALTAGSEFKQLMGD